MICIEFPLICLFSVCEEHSFVRFDGKHQLPLYFVVGNSVGTHCSRSMP